MAYNFKILPTLALGGACAALALTTASHSNAAPPPQELYLILLDQTSSMSTLVPRTTKTRFQDAVAKVTAFLESSTSPTRHYALYTFFNTSPGGKPITHPFYKFQDNAKASDLLTTLKTLAPIGSTPLAGAICEAVDDILEADNLDVQPTVHDNLYVKIYTDGQENNTPTTDQCHGTQGTGTSPWLVAGTWQSKVWNKVFTGSADIPPPNPFPKAAQAILNVEDFSFPPVATASSALAARTSADSMQVDVVREPADQASESGTRTGASALAAVIGPGPTPGGPAPGTDPSLVFLRTLAKRTGGAYVQHKASEPAVIPGDANGDLCVNATDLQIVLNHFGQTVPPGTPYPPYDFDQNGIINNYDRLTVSQHYGQGPGCK